MLGDHCLCLHGCALLIWYLKRSLRFDPLGLYALRIHLHINAFKASLERLKLLIFCLTQWSAPLILASCDVFMSTQVISKNCLAFKNCLNLAYLILNNQSVGASIEFMMTYVPTIGRWTFFNTLTSSWGKNF